MVNKNAFTIEELAEYLGISEHVVYCLVKNGIILSVGLGEEKFLIPKIAVDLWLKGDVSQWKH